MYGFTPRGGGTLVEDVSLMVALSRFIARLGHFRARLRCSGDSGEHVAQIIAQGAYCNAATAADAEGNSEVAVAVGEFVHYPLSCALVLRGTGVVPGHMLGKEIKLAGVPVPDAASRVPMPLVLDVEAVAGRT